MNVLQKALAKMIFGGESWYNENGPYLETKESAAGSAIVATKVGQPQWSERDFLNFAKEGYVENAIAYRCIQLISQSAAAVPILTMNGKIAQDKSPITALINRPSPNSSGSELIESIVGYLKISGNAYVESVRPSRLNVAPKELYSHRPDRIKVIPGRFGLPQGFQYDVNGQIKIWDIDPVTGKGPMLQLKTFNPVDDWYGLSPMEAAAKSIDQHNEAAGHNMATLQNSAVPSGALTFKPLIHDGKVISAPQPVIEAAQKHLMDRHQGARNAGRPLVTNGDVTWTSFAQSMEEMQLSESMLDSARNICNVFGVPFILLVPGQSTYNNVREAKLALYEETVLPTLDWVLDHFNTWLVPQFPDAGDSFLKADKDSLDALSIRREENRKTYIDLFDKKLVKRNEVREELGWEPISDRSDFDPQAHEVTAITSLISSNKLSAETGWRQLAKWGILPMELSTPEGAADEHERLDAQNEASMAANGLLGLSEDPETGEPLDPTTGKPTTQGGVSVVPPGTNEKPGGSLPAPVPFRKPAAA
jgi:HK97 family phage portal protein